MLRDVGNTRQSTLRLALPALRKSQDAPETLQWTVEHFLHAPPGSFSAKVTSYRYLTYVSKNLQGRNAQCRSG